MSRTCITQNTGSVIASGSPASCGGRKSRPSTTAPNSFSIGSISGEWKAWLTASRLVRTPAASHCSRSSSTVRSAPEITTDVGPFTAARLTLSASEIACATSDSGSWTASMVPPAGSACISRARASTRVAASGRVSTPATWAAAISPTECPVTACGVIPQDRSSRYSPTSTAKIATWANPVRSTASRASGLSFC